MTERREFEMTESDLNDLYEACKPVLYMVFCGRLPRSQQDNANDAWCALGRKMGFNGLTVKPSGKGDRFFTAVPMDAPVLVDPAVDAAVVQTWGDGP